MKSNKRSTGSRAWDTIPIPKTELGHVPAAPEDPMVERLKRRVAKYEAKTTPERVARTFAARGPLMLDRYREQAEILSRVERAVAGVTDAAGVPAMMRFWYKGCGREVYRVWRTVPKSCQEVEYEVIRYKWTIRGLDPDLLGKVKAAVIELLEASGFPRKDDEPGGRN
jgi:hypothetical protein